MDYNLFLKCIKFVDNYKMIKPNIYFFMKDCIFQRLYKANGNRFPTTESQNMFNRLQMEMQQSKWKRNSITKNEYQNYLEELFKKINFHTIDLESFEILKIIMENIGIFGAFDSLTTDRIKYFNNKIHNYKSGKIPPNTTNIFSIFQKAHTQVIPHPKANNFNAIPKNTPQNIPQKTPQNILKNTPQNIHQKIPQNTNVNFDLPSAGKGFAKKTNDQEIARLNEIMRQMKLNSPIYITNGQPGQFYNPYTMPNYIPKGVMTNIPLPMAKKDPNYPKLRAIIEKELILANQELDYHKIDMARNHLERVAYYLKNVID